MGDDVTSILLDLLAVDSDTKASKEPIVSCVLDRMKDLGMKTSVIGPKEDPVIVGIFGSEGILFSGHLDTVPIAKGWTRGQGELFENRIYGRGTADMKGSCAAMLASAEELVDEEIPFSIVFTTDEEEKMLGAIAATELPLCKEAKAVVIGEPTGLCPAYREMGVFRFKLSTKGRAAHASQPWLGENAIMKMHHCLAMLTDLAAITEERTTGMTTCISTIEGGVKSNVVPDRCQAEVDIRFPLPQTPEDINAIIVHRLKGLDYEMDVDYTLDAFEIDPKSPLVSELSRFLGTDPIVVPYATEAPKFAAVNPKVIICGPGSPKMAHVVDEYVEIPELEMASKMFGHLAKFVQG